MGYAILTAVRNESQHIAATIESVLAQETLPVRWMIACNGCTDGTDTIVESLTVKAGFIHLVRMPENGGRSFAAKVEALRVAHDSLAGLEYDFIGNLDGDITLPRDYYARVLEAFARNPRLGIAGGTYLDKAGDRFKPGRFDPLYPPGGVQVFRRSCYEDIGGYPVLRWGGEDSAACILARMRGWDTAALPIAPALHLRPWGGGAGRSLLKGRYVQGKMDYHLGMHPLYAILKFGARLGETPLLAGAVARLWGYGISSCLRERRDVSAEFVEHVRAEQLDKLRRLMGKGKTEANGKEC